MEALIPTMHCQQNHSEMEDLFQPPGCFHCPVCLAIFHKPVMLWCSHTVCYSCVERVYEISKTEHRPKLYCPVCRHDIPKTDVKNLPLNRSLMDAYTEWERDMKVRRETYIFSKILICEIHSSDKANIYCEECKVMGCPDCFARCSDLGHSLCDASSEVRKMAKKANISWDVWCKNRDIMDIIKTVAGREKCVDKNYSDYFTIIDTLESDIMKIVTAKFKKIRTSASEKWKNLGPQQKSLRKECVDMLKEVGDFFEKVDSLQGDTDPRDLLHMQQLILEKMGNVGVKIEKDSRVIADKSKMYTKVFQKTADKLGLHLRYVVGHAIDVMEAVQAKLDDPNCTDLDRRLIGEALNTFLDDAGGHIPEELYELVLSRRVDDDPVDVNSLQRRLAERLNSIQTRISQSIMSRGGAPSRASVSTTNSGTTTRTSPRTHRQRMLNFLAQATNSQAANNLHSDNSTASGGLPTGTSDNSSTWFTGVRSRSTTHAAGSSSRPDGIPPLLPVAEVDEIEPESGRSRNPSNRGRDLAWDLPHSSSWATTANNIPTSSTADTGFNFQPNSYHNGYYQFGSGQERNAGNNSFPVFGSRNIASSRVTPSPLLPWSSLYTQHFGTRPRLNRLDNSSSHLTSSGSSMNNPSSSTLSFNGQINLPESDTQAASIDHHNPISPSSSGNFTFVHPSVRMPPENASTWEVQPSGRPSHENTSPWEADSSSRSSQENMYPWESILVSSRTNFQHSPLTTQPMQQPAQVASMPTSLHDEPLASLVLRESPLFNHLHQQEDPNDIMEEGNIRLGIHAVDEDSD